MKTSFSSRMLAVSIAGCALVMATPAVTGAAKIIGGGRKNAPAPPPVEVPEVDSKPAEQAQQELTAARAAKQKADDNLGSVVSRLRDEFEKSPPMVQAMGDLKAAQAAYDASSKPVLEKVHSGADYKAAVGAKAVDEAKITQLHGTAGNEAQIGTLAKDAMTQGSAASKLESDALVLDSGAKAAKANVTAAGVQISKLRAQFNSTLAQNADWQAAKKAADDATTSLETAAANSRTEAGKLASAQAAHNAAQAKKDLQDRAHASAPNNKKPDSNQNN